jgi:hypothetical protein
MADKFNILAISDTPAHFGHEIIRGTGEIGAGMDWWCATCCKWLLHRDAHFPAPKENSIPRLSPHDVGFDLSLHPEIELLNEKQN